MRNERKRLRVGKVNVVLYPPPGSAAALARCKDELEDFCVVTQSVRDGIDVEVTLADTLP